MEEQKKNKVKMSIASDNTQKEQKYTYEQLTDICNKLFQENQYLKNKYQQISETMNTLNRLDYLFRVVEIGHNNKDYHPSFSPDFMQNCINEIQEAMTMPESDTENKEG